MSATTFGQIVESISAAASADAVGVQVEHVMEMMRAPVATFTAECFTAKEGKQAAVVEAQDLIARLRDRSGNSRLAKKARERLIERADALHQHMCAELMVQKWIEVKDNTVTTGGKNDLLDKYFGGSSYTAAWYCGLISSVSYTAINVADTMASHAGWTEAGPTNAPNYSSGTRVALAFSAASAGSKATSSASSFTFSGGGTIKGMFGTTVSTKDGTTGILYNAVLFTGGDRAVVSTDVVNVSVTYSA